MCIHLQLEAGNKAVFVVIKWKPALLLYGESCEDCQSKLSGQGTGSSSQRLWVWSPATTSYSPSSPSAFHLLLLLVMSLCVHAHCKRKSFQSCERDIPVLWTWYPRIAVKTHRAADQYTPVIKMWPLVFMSAWRCACLVTWNNKHFHETSGHNFVGS